MLSPTLVVHCRRAQSQDAAPTSGHLGPLSTVTLSSKSPHFVLLCYKSSDERLSSLVWCWDSFETNLISLFFKNMGGEGIYEPAIKKP